MKNFTFSLLALGFCGLLHAQSLSPTVVSSSGGFYSNASGQLSFTVGEMTMVQTFSKANSILTQGFQQVFDFGTSVPEPTKESFAFLVYPNPSSGYIHLVLNTKNNVYVNLRLFDALGKTVTSDRFNHLSGANTYSYNWSNLSNGMYMLEVITTDQANNTTQKSLKKINIIY